MLLFSRTSRQTDSRHFRTFGPCFYNDLVNLVPFEGQLWFHACSSLFRTGWLLFTKSFSLFLTRSNPLGRFAPVSRLLFRAPCCCFCRAPAFKWLAPVSQTMQSVWKKALVPFERSAPASGNTSSLSCGLLLFLTCFNPFRTVCFTNAPISFFFYYRIYHY